MLCSNRAARSNNAANKNDESRLSNKKTMQKPYRYFSKGWVESSINLEIACH
jgi:hypothetical protein